MTIRNVSEARRQLSTLIELARSGEEVVIARSGKPVARLIAHDAPRQPRKFGAQKGIIWISPDFDAPDPELEKLFYEGPIEPEP